ncbi:MAG: pyridoxamine 5'-phosphate oxidase family protein [Acidobacteria bacterium]|jgi:general stress protein 26|nr:pyridoxamine 5'-phosphate oxidase family protein [Acidobacteriota bacterium]MBA3786951.1 pyridoxamine 5'-phosphate oxidase family protein [Acidobacteriota bacterium]MBA4122451.1 pyridoxamine 5'-phosphate oxidase family protein [Acidobacteriota bacterium]HEV8158797.1 pyridoxamine 5'-phosphate oxidase family protein [Pyrinomonadaceae bacterium]
MEDKRQESIKKVNDLIKDVQVAMLTTIDWGVLRSRPMQTQEAEFDGDLWFFTSTDTHKTDEIEKDRRVNVSYAAPDSNTYVSVSGTAALVNDKEKIEELWNPILKAWFPKGLDDPTLILLKVSVEQAEYWDSSSSTVVQVVGFVKALVTGERADGGDHGRVNL